MPRQALGVDLQLREDRAAPVVVLQDAAQLEVGKHHV
jgi:hypothetical protein